MAEIEDNENSSIDELWRSMEIDKVTDTRITMRVAEIKSYLASPSNTRLWNSKLQRKGIKQKIIILHDVVVYTSKGRRLRVLLNPMKESVKSGKLLIDTVIIATQAVKHQIQSMTDISSKLCYLFLHDWIYHPEPGKVDKVFRSMPPLEGYLSESCPNGNPTGSELCNWTHAGIDKPPQTHLQRLNSLRSVPAHVLRLYEPSQHHLKNLEGSWNHMTTRMPLCVRVVLKSKDRMLVRQEDARKPIILLTTLLVADSTGMCKLTVWDEAVLSFNNISEGDQILLAGRYKVGFYNDKYLLEPKVRIPQPRVKIELKLNTSDLKDVFILDHAVDIGLPPPIWNFYSVDQLTLNKVPSGRVIDVIGMILHHGRWERESCTEPNSNSLTGQFWIRVWFKLVDHTCLNNIVNSDSQNQTENFVWIKMYVDLEKFDSCQSLTSSSPAVITNVLCVYSENRFSHLESSNETQIFAGDQAFSSRFLQTSILDNEHQKTLNDGIKKNNQIIEAFRVSWNSDSVRWSELYDSCTLGGNSIPLRLIKTMYSLTFNLEIMDFLQGLPYLTGARIMISGKPTILKEYIISFNGSVQETETSILNEPSSDENRYAAENLLADLPCLQNCSRHPLDMNCTSAATNSYCFLSLDKNRDMVETVVVARQVFMVLIESRDYRIWVEAPTQFKQQLQDIKEANIKYCVDFFRYEGSQKPDGCDGVEATMRRIYSTQQEQQEHAKEGQQQEKQQTLDPGAIANSTMDFISGFG